MVEGRAAAFFVLRGKFVLSLAGIRVEAETVNAALQYCTAFLILFLIHFCAAIFRCELSLCARATRSARWLSQAGLEFRYPLAQGLNFRLVGPARRR